MRGKDEPGSTRELRTEPELALGLQPRQRAIELWCAHHRISPLLRTFLTGVVLGEARDELATHLGLREEELVFLEAAFEASTTQNIYVVAADILNAAHEAQRRAVP